jgi:hypothetical protein
VHISELRLAYLICPPLLISPEKGEGHADRLLQSEVGGAIFPPAVHPHSFVHHLSPCKHLSTMTTSVECYRSGQNMEARKRYPAHQAFNFFKLLLPTSDIYYMHHKVHSNCGHGNFVILEVLDISLPKSVKVKFYRDKIAYTMDDHIHQIDDAGVIDYIYFIMSFGCETWMRRTVMNVVRKNNVMSLTKMAMRQIPYARYGHESVLRRYLSSAESVLRYCNIQNKPASSSQHVDDFKATAGRWMERSFHFQSPSPLTDTLYMHKLQLYGDYSREVDYWMLPYLLLTEAVMCSKKKWIRVDYGTYYCQLEEYHFFIRRSGWMRNLSLYIFLDEHISRAMAPIPLFANPLRDHCWVNSPRLLPLYMTRFEEDFRRLFLLRHFFGVRYVRVKPVRLADACKVKVMKNFFMAKALRIADKKLKEVLKDGKCEVVGIDPPYSGTGSLWNSICLAYLNITESLPKQFAMSGFGRLVQGDLGHMERLHKLVVKAWKLAQSLPTTYTLSLYQLGMDYIMWGTQESGVFAQLDPLGLDLEL